MLETGFTTKEKSLEQIQYYKTYYQQVYLQAKKKGKAVLRHHLQKLERLIQQKQANSSSSS